eukprot:scaffold14479_cov23-Tisochrysis_lutea.AAC.1
MDDGEHVQVLALVLMNALDLDVEQGVQVDIVPKHLHAQRNGKTVRDLQPRKCMVVEQSSFIELLRQAAPPLFASPGHFV